MPADNERQEPGRSRVEGSSLESEVVERSLALGIADHLERYLATEIGSAADTGTAVTHCVENTFMAANVRRVVESIGHSARPAMGDFDPVELRKYADHFSVKVVGIGRRPVVLMKGASAEHHASAIGRWPVVDYQSRGPPKASTFRTQLAHQVLLQRRRGDDGGSKRYHPSSKVG